jgi:hypothetical protein
MDIKKKPSDKEATILTTEHCQGNLKSVMHCEQPEEGQFPVFAQFLTSLAK